MIEMALHQSNNTISLEQSHFKISKSDTTEMEFTNGEHERALKMPTTYMGSD